MKLDALLVYGKLLEVEFALRVSVSQDVVVTIPIQIVNFLSLDPPPSVSYGKSCAGGPRKRIDLTLVLPQDGSCTPFAPGIPSPAPPVMYKNPEDGENSLVREEADLLIASTSSDEWEIARFSDLYYMEATNDTRKQISTDGQCTSSEVDEELPVIAHNTSTITYSLRRPQSDIQPVPLLLRHTRTDPSKTSTIPPAVPKASSFRRRTISDFPLREASPRINMFSLRVQEKLHAMASPNTEEQQAASESSVSPMIFPLPCLGTAAYCRVAPQQHSQDLPPSKSTSKDVERGCIHSKGEVSTPTEPAGPVSFVLEALREVPDTLLSTLGSPYPLLRRATLVSPGSNVRSKEVETSIHESKQHATLEGHSILKEGATREESIYAYEQTTSSGMDATCPQVFCEKSTSPTHPQAISAESPPHSSKVLRGKNNLSTLRSSPPTMMIQPEVSTLALAPVEVKPVKKTPPPPGAIAAGKFKSPLIQVGRESALSVRDRIAALEAKVGARFRSE
jgi:hypothetical protein